MNRRTLSGIWFVVLLLASGSACANDVGLTDVKLAWTDDANDPNIIQTYRIFWGTATGNYVGFKDVGEDKFGTVPDLVQGVRYYFAVKAIGFGGLESDYSDELPYTVPDTTPPSIAFTSPVSTGSYESSGNTILIAGTASDNIDVTKVYWRCGGATGVASGTASWSVPSVPLLPGANVVTATAVDAALNFSEASLSVTYSPDFPVITKVTRIELSSTSVQIRWLTNVPSDSTVSYGTDVSLIYPAPTDYSEVYSHSITLTGLVSGTLYYYRASSRDSQGRLATSDIFTFTQGTAAQTLTLPRLFTGGFGSGSEFVSVALADLDSAPADLTFTAYDTEGNRVSGQGILNPKTVGLAPGEQLAKLDGQLFSFDSPTDFLSGWMLLETNARRLSGFFLMYDKPGDQVTSMDGALMTTAPLRSLLMPDIQGSGYTKLNVTNTDYDQGTISIDLLRSDGTFRKSQSVKVAGRGSLIKDVYADLFPGITPDPSDYIRVRSWNYLASYEQTGERGKDTAILGGLDSSRGATVLYSPQYVVGGAWKSTLSIINVDSVAGKVTLSLFKEDGTPAGQTRTENIAAQGKLYIDDQAYFVEPGETETQGYVKVVGDGIGLAGSIRLSNSGGSAAALPLVSILGGSLVFGQVASNDQYYTGVSILNPGISTADVSIDVYSEIGALRCTKAVELLPGHRITQLLTEYFPELVGQSLTSGYIRVTANQDVAGFALFGMPGSNVLSAIPAQLIP